MAIKRKRTATYVSDRGEEYELDRMDTPHIINVLAYHYRQLDALERLPGNVRTAKLDLRIEQMNDMIIVLGEEIASRDPNTENEDE